MAEHLVVDCDPGVDDAVALAYLAHAHDRGHAHIDAVSTVAGNVAATQTARNAVFVLDHVGLGNVPVFAGTTPALGAPDEAVDTGAFHGLGGLGSIEVPAHWNRSVIADPAVLADRYLRATRAGATLVALGPLTNIARAIRARPELTDSIPRLVVMGGAFGSPPGNITPHAEFNFRCDAQAAHEVLDSGVPTTIVPLDVTGQVVIGPDDLADIADTGRGRLIRELFAWRFREPRRDGQEPGCVMHDALAAAVALDPELVTTERGTVEVATRGEAVGQSTLHRGDGTVEVAIAVDVSAARATITDALGALCAADDPGEPPGTAADRRD